MDTLGYMYVPAVGWWQHVNKWRLLT